jgi:HEPN domain-containing protein
MIENAVSVQGSDGAYYHYLEVCKLLKLQQQGYTDDEVLEIIRQYALEEHLITSSKPDIWFEQFKNK